jgi:hypothetical protein
MLPAPFALVVFQGVWCFLLGPALDCDAPTSASHIAGLQI